MYNLKLKSKQIRKTVALSFDDIESDDEWITKDGDNVGFELVQGEGDEGNVDIIGSSSVDFTLRAFDLDNIVFYANVDDAHLSSEEELDGDGEDDEEEDDVRDDIFRGLEPEI